MTNLSSLTSERRRITLAAMQAIDEKKVLQLDYGGWTRLVEVHAVGVSTAGNPVLRGWQLTGGSQSGGHAGWKLFDLDKVPETFKLTDYPSEAPREGFRRGDNAMLEIFREV